MSMENNQNVGIPLGVTQVPADQAIKGTPEVYPKFEEMTFRALVQSPEQAMKLLTYIQAIINEMGVEAIIGLIGKLEKNPSLLPKIKGAMSFLM